MDYGGFMKSSWMPLITAAMLPAFTLALLSGCGNFRAAFLSYPAGEEKPLEKEYRDGVYEGTGQGYRGPVLVRLRLKAGEIVELEILDHQDDMFAGGPAMEELAELVLEYNTAGLDGISGATESSAGFLAAVEDALTQARGNEPPRPTAPPR
jgi:uncharacterized protein with FMN-binding domain